jgi:hypothetical protein
MENLLHCIIHAAHERTMKWRLMLPAAGGVLGKSLVEIDVIACL